MKPKKPTIVDVVNKVTSLETTVSGLSTTVTSLSASVSDLSKSVGKLAKVVETNEESAGEFREATAHNFSDVVNSIDKLAKVVETNEESAGEFREATAHNFTVVTCKMGELLTKDDFDRSFQSFSDNDHKLDKKLDTLVVRLHGKQILNDSEKGEIMLAGPFSRPD